MDIDQREAVQHIYEARAKAIVPKRFWGGFEKFKPLNPEQRQHAKTLRVWCKRIIDDRTSNGYFMTGPTGCGKSLLAYSVVWELVARGLHVVAWNVREFYQALMNSYDWRTEDLEAEILESAQVAHLLLLDDFGSEPQNPQNGQIKGWALERLYTLVNHRSETLLPVLLTSNLNGTELSKQMESDMGQRIISRLQEMVETMQFEGPDLRGKNRKDAK